MNLAAVSARDPGDDLEDYLFADAMPEGFDDLVDRPVADFPIPDPLAQGKDAGLANALCRALRFVERQREADVAIAGAERARIDAWLVDRLDRADRRASWLRLGLEHFARATGRATVNLPNGTLRLRTSQTRVNVTNEDAATAWLGAERPECVNVRRTVAKNPVSARLAGERPTFFPTAWEDGIVNGEPVLVAELRTADGEQVPGVQLVRARDDRTFSVTVRDA